MIATVRGNPNRRTVLALCALSFVSMFGVPLGAQQHESALSDAEVERLRDSAYFPPSRILAFIDFLDLRIGRIDKLTTGKRQPGREEDIHDLMEQIASIADNFVDNLDDYSKYHRDIRKVLPKVVSATERWATSLRTPPEDAAYSVSRKLALESLADVRASATKLVEEQKAWFFAHPPVKDNENKSQPRS